MLWRTNFNRYAHNFRARCHLLFIEGLGAGKRSKVIWIKDWGFLDTCLLMCIDAMSLVSEI
jgi:hypothetical protein